ncbi:hypothetical protein [Dactylosporangium sp. CA-233914]|uniref:hypothetical protein n=1 Tax=Dactylosporangium sp. CA-233914 TaxID=3239934 RepID=UPI003D913CCD
MRAWRPLRTTGEAWRRAGAAVLAALFPLELGQLIRPHSWPVTALYLTTMAIATAGILLLYVEQRRARRRH